MSEAVFSEKNLTAEFEKHFANAAPAARSSPAALRAAAPKRKAIFAIHGIHPTQRYAFQDQVALALRSYLNAREKISKSGFEWVSVVHWPRLAKQAPPTALRPSALRIYRKDDDPEDPKNTVYDVYEGYWSPLTKGKTNIISAAQWLLNVTFLATSSTAAVPCTPQKLWSDLRYVGMLLVSAAFLTLAGAGIALAGWMQFVRAFDHASATMSFGALLNHPAATALKLPLEGYVELGVVTVTAYLLAQLIVVLNVSLRRKARTAELSEDQDKNPRQSTFYRQVTKAAAFHLWTFIILLMAFILAAFVAVGVPMIWEHRTFSYVVGAGIVGLAILVFQSARAAADFAVIDVLGDVQVYTTHDNNSTFYAIRQLVVQTVCDSLIGVLAAKVPDKPGPNADGNAPERLYYDTVHIFGHSLGSTIGMDALIFLRQMVEEGALTHAYWNRIQSFTTFGTSLEKTKFFFDVRQPTISAAEDQWTNDVYGRFFTDDKNALNGAYPAGVIYWNNLWYFKDIVANRIVSYTSDVAAGTPFTWTPTDHPICDDHELEHAPSVPWAWIHSDYLSDMNFWAQVGPIVA